VIAVTAHPFAFSLWCCETHIAHLFVYTHWSMARRIVCITGVMMLTSRHYEHRNVATALRVDVYTRSTARRQARERERKRGERERGEAKKKKPVKLLAFVIVASYELRACRRV
jgi:hypothetical protein